MANNNQPQAQQTQQDELVKGVVGFFHTISGSKTRIVYTNVLTGNLHVKTKGLFWNWPWRIRPVTVSLDQQKVDTPERTTHTASTGTSTGPTISYDTDYFLKIVDPVKFVEATESRSASEIRRTIGDLLDQKIRDYIITQDYATLMGRGAIDFATQLSSGTPSLAQQIRDDYGVEVRNVMFRVKPPKSLVEEANKTALAQQAQRTATAEAERDRIAALGRAQVTTITADAEKQRLELEGAALAQNIQSWIGAGMTNEQVAVKLANEALTNGTNQNTIVVASAAANGAVAGANPNFDMAAMMALFTQIMQRQQAQNGAAQVSGVNNVAPAPAPAVSSAAASQQPDQVDWASLPDDEYLTAEDSAALAAERRAKNLPDATILPGARFHISLLSAEEKKHYVVASQKGGIHR